MKTTKRKFIALFLTACSFTAGAIADPVNYTVAAKEVHGGFFVQKIWLSNYAIPTVKLTNLSYINNVPLPGDAKSVEINEVETILGMERKRPFMLVRVPVFSRLGDGYRKLDAFTLDFTEKPLNEIKAAQKTTDVTGSALATGTWYKIATTQTGFYKLDFNFFKSLGIDPATINPANIRVFGNGGYMLSENNAVPRISDLAENAIIVNDGGDNAFNNGDYALFYALGTTEWVKDSVNQKFKHIKNLYADTAYYFITVNNGAGLRVVQQAAAPTANITSTGFNYYDVHEADLVNPTTYGKSWFGEQFYTDAASNSQSFSFNLGDNVTLLTTRIGFAGTQQTGGSGLSVTLNGSPLGSSALQNVTAGDVILTHISPEFTGNCNSAVANIGLNFTPSADGHGYLDYIEVFGRRSLNITGTQLNFRDWQTVGAGKIAAFAMAGANSGTRVWDITNPHVPVQMAGTLSGSTYSFAQDASYLHEYAAFNSADVFVPKFIAPVSNQNLHALGTADLIVVTAPEFVEGATKIAEYHQSHDKMRVVVATTTQIYNEFSSGAQDISAIRDFARMFYKKAGTDVSKMPKYLLMMGNGSYDYKNRIPNNANYVPTFESANDSNDIYSFVTDDFFGFLDDNENSESTTVINALDLGVGRIPVRNSTDALTVADKIVNYQSAATLGPWRTLSMFVADDNDGAGNHMDDAETMASQINQSGKNLYNEQKVYVNGIPVISTPAGPRCPNANASINEQIYKGAFMVNYNGHGNPQVWTSERILTADDFNNWNNKNMLPFMITATCDFGQYDHPQYVSAAEQLMIKEGGGAIALVTTTGAVYSGYNSPMNQTFLSAQFTKNTDGSWNTFGDALRIGKNNVYATSHSADEITNFRKFVLLGDPALTPDFPKDNIRLDSVFDGTTMKITDSIKALGKYILRGSVRDNNNAILTNFNGTVFVTFFDKARSITVDCYDRTTRTYKMQDNLIYKGKVSVTNGIFNLTFITPKDINYYFGKGKVSTYAENGSSDAAGADTNIAVGGFSADPILNSEPPVVRAFINDSSFITGGITGTNTSLFAVLNSVTGINVSGFSIGHNLTAVLDDNNDAPYILNDYYETAPNTYQLGYVRFPVTGLANGKHILTVKAWDVNNNSGEGSVEFEVVDGKIAAINNLGNYPNPFANSTHFVFEHNHPDEEIKAQIYIYSTEGKLVKVINETFTAGNSRSTELTWDGTDNNSIPLPPGIYVYKLNIETDKGFKASAYQKLVIVR